MKVSGRGLTEITRSEGVRLCAYPDPGTGGAPWTIGYGHTKGVVKGQTITMYQAISFLQEDLTWVEKCIEDNVTVKLNQNQFDALVSFIFNIGCGAFHKSTLLKLLNEGKYALAQKEFAKWNKAGGRVMGGLVARRKRESELFGAVA